MIRLFIWLTIATARFAFWLLFSVLKLMVWSFVATVRMADALNRWYRTLSPEGQIGFWIACGVLMIIGLVSWAVEAIVA